MEHVDDVEKNPIQYYSARQGMKFAASVTVRDTLQNNVFLKP